MSIPVDVQHSNIQSSQSERLSITQTPGTISDTPHLFKMEQQCSIESTDKLDSDTTSTQNPKCLHSIQNQKPSTSQDSANSSFELPFTDDPHLIKNGTHPMRLNNGLLFPDFSRSHMVHDPYYYDDYDYELSPGGFDHSPMLGRGFGRHRGKIDGDPTILLTLVRWARIGSSQLRGDDDQIDRINYQITSVLLLVLLMLTGFRQYLSHLPLQCWIPQEFSRSWEEYAEHYCWVTNTYFSNIQSALPKPDERTSIVRYYQWATFVLALQAAGFVLPCLLWRLFQNNSGFHVQRVMRSAIRLSCTPPDSLQTSIKNLAHYMDSIIYHKTYKTWRKKFEHSTKTDQRSDISSPKQSSHLTKEKDNSKASSSLSSTNTPITPFKTVQFGDPIILIKDDIPADPNISVSLRHTIPRSHKKVRAPLPPGSASISSDQVHLCSSSQATTKSTKIATSPVVTKTSSKSHLSRSSSSSNIFSNSCSLCLAKCCIPKHGTYTQGKLGRTKSPATDRIRMRQDIPSSSKRSSSSTPKCPTSLCCSCSRSMEPEFDPLANNSHPISQTQPRKFWKQTCIQLCSGCWLVIKFILTLTCLFPVCLCQWCRGNHKIKGLRKNNSFLFYLYVTIKLLYLINILGQLYFMKLFLGTDSCLFGFYVLRDLALGNIWTQTGNFPRVTYCDFEAKKLGKNYRYTLQCVLPLNLFLEKVYIFLWFWMLLLCLLTLYSLFKWLTRLIIPQSRINFVSNFLRSWDFHENLDNLNQKSLKMFVEKYLDLDGVFLLWLISINAGDLVIGELVIALWRLFSTRLSTQNPNYPIREKDSHIRKVRSQRPVRYFYCQAQPKICPSHVQSCPNDSNLPIMFRSHFNPVYSPHLYSNHGRIGPNNLLRPVLFQQLTDRPDPTKHVCKFISPPVNLHEHQHQPQQCLHHNHHRTQQQQQSINNVAQMQFESCGSSDSIV